MPKKSAPYLNLDERALNIFTDGSCLPKPRRGGWAYRLVDVDADGHEVTEDYAGPGVLGATNNQMEMKAIIEALRYSVSKYCKFDVASKSKVVVYTDSQYVYNNLNRALFEWPMNGWMTKDGNPVANTEVWKDLVDAYHRVRQVRPVKVEWAKGHSKTNPHNKAVDKLAKESAKSAHRPPLEDVEVRRKVSNNEEVRGCVKMRGQRTTIRIVTEEYNKVQGLFEYKYEVMAGPNKGLVDRIYSEHHMRAHHTYSVRVNEDTKQPRVVKVFREVIKEKASG